MRAEQPTSRQVSNRFRPAKHPTACFSKKLNPKVWRFLKKLKIELPYDPAIPLLGIYPEKNHNSK